LSTPFDDRWREAIDRYQAAIVECERFAQENATAVKDGVAPTAVSFSKEEKARARVVEAREAVLGLLFQIRGGDPD
jgi:hypothetical protein